MMSHPLHMNKLWSRTSQLQFIIRTTLGVVFKIQIYKPNPTDAEPQGLSGAYANCKGTSASDSKYSEGSPTTK